MWSPPPLADLLILPPSFPSPRGGAASSSSSLNHLGYGRSLLLRPFLMPRGKEKEGKEERLTRWKATLRSWVVFLRGSSTSSAADGNAKKKEEITLPTQKCCSSKSLLFGILESSPGLFPTEIKISFRVSLQYKCFISVYVLFKLHVLRARAKIVSERRYSFIMNFFSRRSCLCFSAHKSKVAIPTLV